MFFIHSDGSMKLKNCKHHLSTIKRALQRFELVLANTLQPWNKTVVQSFERFNSDAVKKLGVRVQAGGVHGRPAVMS